MIHCLTDCTILAVEIIEKGVQLIQANPEHKTLGFIALREFK